MKHLALVVTAVVALGSVHLTRAALADGKPLASGTYQIRTTGDEPKPAAGQSANAEQWIEFLKGGKVVGREVATVVSATAAAPPSRTTSSAAASRPIGCAP